MTLWLDFSPTLLLRIKGVKIMEKDKDFFLTVKAFSRRGERLFTLCGFSPWSAIEILFKEMR